MALAHHWFPRQSSTSESSEAPAPSTTDAVSSSPTASQTSSSMSATKVSSTTPTSSAEQSSSPSPTSATSTEPTTTSSPARSTSTEHPTSPSPSSDHVQSTTSDAPASSSSSSESTASETASSSSGAPPSTTPPLTSTASFHSETLTTITSAYTTYLNGSQILTSTVIPSTIPEESNTTSSHRSAIIAGSAAGGTALLILLLSLAFYARRKRFKRLHFLDAIMLKRKQDRSRAMLLDGEDVIPETPPRYTDYETPWDGRAHERAPMIPEEGVPGMASAVRDPAHTHAPHWSETGSAFREDLWSPPSESTRLMDPLANRDDLDLGLGRIVDDIMGPSTTAGHYSDQSLSSVYVNRERGRGEREEGGRMHSRTMSNASNLALLAAAGLAGPGVGESTPIQSSPLVNPGSRSESDQGGNES